MNSTRETDGNKVRAAHTGLRDLLAEVEQDRRLITTRVSTDDEFQDAV